MKKTIKRIIFTLIVVSLILTIGLIIKTGKFKKLEGYMYSFAAEIIESATCTNATDSNVPEQSATSTNATSSNVPEQSATSSNATSSNVPEQSATSSNATSSNVPEQSATSSNATSSNVPEQSVTNSNVINNNNTQNKNQENKNTKPEEDNNNEEPILNEDTTSGNVEDTAASSNANILDNDNEEDYSITANKEVKTKVSFLESNKMYIIIIGASILAIVIISIILVLDKRGIAKRKAKANDEEKLD